MFFRSASPQERRQIQTHDKWPTSSPNGLPNETQAQPRERPYFGGKVCQTVVRVFPAIIHVLTVIGRIWILSKRCDIFWSFHVSGESVRWAGAVVERPREQHQHQHQHRRCLTGLRAPRPPGVQHQAPPALCPPMCTTHQSWMNHSPSSRNQEKTLRTQRRRPKALLPLKSR